MFTVLHQEHGIDNIYPAAGVTYRGPLSHYGPQGLEIMTANGTDRPILHTGKVFVMNEAGATVAKYILGDTAPAPAPIG